MIDQGELFVIPNPCRGICTVNNRGYCKGCLRNRNERFYWHEFSPFHQQLIINACEKRRLKILAAKNAQPEELSEEIIPQLDMFAEKESLTTLAQESDIEAAASNALNTELVSQTAELEIPQPEAAGLISEAPSLFADEKTEAKEETKSASLTKRLPKKQSSTASKPANTPSQGDDQFDLF